MNRALLCPGQGAQSVGMGKDLAEASSACRALFDTANDIMGVDLAHVCFEGPESELTRSSYTQPGIFVVSAACHAELKARLPALEFDAAAGLSSGEWAALYVAEVLSFTDTVRVLEARGRFMQEACEAEPGGMLSVIGLDHEALAAICEEADIEMANLNSPQQTVLSGTREGIEAAVPLATAAGAIRAIPLKVSGAFHSRLMAGAAQKLDNFLDDISFSVPCIPVISNVTGLPHTSPDAIRAAMVSQVTSPVRWYQGVEALRSQGVTEYVECGPGRVLTGLVKRIDKGAGLATIRDLASLENYLVSAG